MIHKIGIITFGLLAAVGCQTAKTTTDIPKPATKSASAPKQMLNQNPDEKPTKGIVYLKEGQNVFLNQYEMNVTFQGVLEDSRCPPGTNCFWVGNATVDVVLMGTYTRPMHMQLSTFEDAKKGKFRTGIFNGYKVSLVNMSETKPYQIGLKFEKAEGNAPDPTTKSGDMTK